MMSVLNYLRVVGADQDEDGRFIIGGEGFVSFMGMEITERSDVLIPSETVYFVGGEPANLSAGLRSTSSGIGVTVII
jgi:hypothetical protein